MSSHGTHRDVQIIINRKSKLINLDDSRHVTMRRSQRCVSQTELLETADSTETPDASSATGSKNEEECVKAEAKEEARETPSQSMEDSNIAVGSVFRNWTRPRANCKDPVWLYDEQRKEQLEYQ